MNWITGLILGKNGKASVTKIASWLIGLLGILQHNFPGALPADIVASVQNILFIFLGIGAKNAIDKSASPGTLANPK